MVDGGVADPRTTHPPYRPKLLLTTTSTISLQQQQ